MDNNNVSNEQEIHLTPIMRFKLDRHKSNTIAVFAAIVLIMFLLPVIVEHFKGDSSEGIKAGAAFAVILLIAFFDKIRMSGQYKLYEVVCEGKTKNIVYKSGIDDMSYQREVIEYKIAYHLYGTPKFIEIDEKMYENIEMGDKFYVVVYPKTHFKYALEHDFFDK